MIVAGVFKSWADAERGAAELHFAGVSGKNLNVLTPDSRKEKGMIAEAPRAEGEQPGILTAIGAVAGGAVGMGLGEGLASLLVPGIGPVAAIGLVGGAVLGALAGGTLAGGTMGRVEENAVFPNLPGDEVYIYEDALRKGKTVVLVVVEDAKEAETARTMLTDLGAESVDRARENWWVGLRGVEKEHYEARGGNFERDEANFRRGFAAALELPNRGKSFDQCLPDLKASYPESANSEAFHQGYERGHEYISTIGTVKKETAATGR